MTKIFDLDYNSYKCGLHATLSTSSFSFFLWNKFPILVLVVMLKAAVILCRKTWNREACEGAKYGKNVIHAQ